MNSQIGVVTTPTEKSRSFAYLSHRTAFPHAPDEHMFFMDELMLVAYVDSRWAKNIPGVFSVGGHQEEGFLNIRSLSYADVQMVALTLKTGGTLVSWLVDPKDDYIAQAVNRWATSEMIEIGLVSSESRLVRVLWDDTSNGVPLGALSGERPGETDEGSEPTYDALGFVEAATALVDSGCFPYSELSNQGDVQYESINVLLTGNSVGVVERGALLRPLQALTAAIRSTGHIAFAAPQPFQLNGASTNRYLTSIRPMEDADVKCEVAPTSWLPAELYALVSEQYFLCVTVPDSFRHDGMPFADDEAEIQDVIDYDRKELYTAVLLKGGQVEIRASKIMELMVGVTSQLPVLFVGREKWSFVSYLRVPGEKVSAQHCTFFAIDARLPASLDVKTGFGLRTTRATEAAVEAIRPNIYVEFRADGDLLAFGPIELPGLLDDVWNRDMGE